MPRWTRPLPDAPAEPVAIGNGHKSKAEKALTVQLSEERLKRLIAQNEKLQIELKAHRGNLVDFDTIKRQVLAANTTVKQQLLALPDRVAGDLTAMTDAFAIRALLTKAITEALNQLAYEHQGH
jgi:hypothetical protein